MQFFVVLLTYESVDKNTSVNALVYTFKLQ